MSSARLTLLLSICCILFARGTYSTNPPRIKNGYFFTCSSICSKYLKGETFYCVPSRGSELASSSLVIRLLSNFDWRYYRIHGHTHTKEFCENILVADQFYPNENKTICNPVLHKRISSGAVKIRFSGGILKAGTTSIERLLSLLDDITKLAKKIQKEIMMTNEKNNSKARLSSNRSISPNIGSPNILTHAGSLAKNALKVTGLINSVNDNSTQNTNRSWPYSGNGHHLHSAKNVSDNKHNITKNARNKRSIFAVERSANTEHFQTNTSDARTDGLCYWASKSLCQQKRMVVCFEKVCCWAKIKSDLCTEILADNDINKYRKNIYDITQATNPC